MADEARAEADGATVGEAKWKAVKKLQSALPGIEVDDVSFTVLNAGDPEDGSPARVLAVSDAGHAPEALPDEPVERVRVLVAHVVRALDLRASVDIAESEEEIRATVNGEDLGLLIGKHGATIDALQHLAVRAAFKGHDQRKSVVIDAAGYRERREAALQRAADQAAEDAVRYGRAVELEPMNAQERRVVHTYLRDRTDVQTHSEGDEPDRRLVVTPVRSR